MFIPLHTNDDNASSSSLRLVPPRIIYQFLERRKGGGGGGHASGHSSSSSSGKGSSSEGPSSGAKGGKSSSFSSSSAAKSFPLSSGSSTKSSASAYSNGGGNRLTIPSGSLFSGRQAGGADRSTVYGTSRYGSGYPYGASGSYVAGRPFPYYFYPVCIYPGYYDNDEYCHLNATEQTGGNLTEAIIQPSYITSSVTYRIVGDNSSVTAVYAALVANCSVANSSSAVSLFVPSLTTYPLPEQVIQWYRSSSFALSLDGYNNSASSLSNMPSSNSTPPLPLSSDTPLSAGLNMTFLQCLNSTIGQSVPLVDPPQSSSLSSDAIAGITMGSLVAFFFLVYWCFICCGWCCSRRRNGMKDQREFLGEKESKFSPESIYKFEVERKRSGLAGTGVRPSPNHIRVPSESGWRLLDSPSSSASISPRYPAIALPPLSPSLPMPDRMPIPERFAFKVSDRKPAPQYDDALSVPLPLKRMESERLAMPGGFGGFGAGSSSEDVRVDVHILDLPLAHVVDEKVAK